MLPITHQEAILLSIIKGVSCHPVCIGFDCNNCLLHKHCRGNASLERLKWEALTLMSKLRSQEELLEIFI